MKLPQHVAIIVDGNRRWARKKGLPDIAGHKQVTDKILEPLIYRCLDLGIPYITFWAFSTENWKRGKRFAGALFSLLRQGLNRSIEKYNQAGMRLKTIGDLSKLPKDLVKVIEEWKEKSKKNKKITVTMALNYGGRDEIVRAIERVLKSKIKNQKSKITEKEFEKYLDTAGMPDPELIIRTGGSQRLSGFMLWQAEYSELYFTDVFMPDFTVAEFNRALRDFFQRQRRFGK
jgi:undecaprenyl diphosphate synthase